MPTYENLPATLSALFSTRNDPQGTEPISVLDDALRQTRNWMYDFLTLSFDDNGKIKPSAFSSTGPVPTGSIRGASALNGTPQEIAAGSIRNADIADGTISGAKLAPLAITGASIKDISISGDKLIDGSVSAAKLAGNAVSGSLLADGTVAGAKLVPGSVNGDRIVSNSITSLQLGAKSVTGAHLPIGLAGQILVGGNGEGEKQFVARTLSGAIYINELGVTQIQSGIAGASVSYALVVEKGSSGVATQVKPLGWSYRGGDTAPPWGVVQPTRTFIEAGLTKVHFLEGGVYQIRCSVPFSGTGTHQAKLVLTQSNVNTSYIGTSVDASTDATTVSIIEAVVTISAAAAEEPLTRPYLSVRHYSTIAGRYGRPAGSLTDALIDGASGVVPGEVYAIMSILRIQETV